MVNVCYHLIAIKICQEMSLPSILKNKAFKRRLLEKRKQYAITLKLNNEQSSTERL